MSLLGRFFGSRSKAGGKAIMATESTATPPAIDEAALEKALQKVLGPVIDAKLSTAITAAVKPLNDRMEKLATPAPAATAEKKDEAKALTLADVEKLLDTKLSATQQSSQAKAQREAFISEKLKDLPPVYARQLGDDPAKWAAEEQSIRNGYKADMESKGFKVAPVGDVTTDGGLTADKKPLDLSKMTPQQLMEQAYKDGTTAASASAAAATGTK